MSSDKISRHDSDVKDPVEAHDDVKKPSTPEERQARLKAAMAEDPGLSGWNARAIKFYLIVLCITCCSGDSGFDGTVMSGINAMTQYQHYFGLAEAGPKTGIVFGIYTIGNLVGAFPASYLPDRIGRRYTMFFGNLVLVIGAILTATANSSGRFLGGRFLTGFGVACAGAAAKSYLAEVTPPQTRGRYLGILNSFFYVGQITATGMMIGTQKMQSENSWRLPLYIQAIPAGINVIFIHFCPESPRWLYTVGKMDEAKAILARLHSRDNDINSPLIRLEVEEIEEHVKIGGADKTWWDFRPLFRTKADRARMWMVILIGAFGQLSGNGMITYFLPILLKNAGITSDSKRITLNFVNSVTSMIGAVTGAYLVDSFGRRKLLLSSTTALVVILAIACGLLSNPGDNQVRANAGITFIYLFMVVFSFGWTSMQALYPAEVLSYQMRAKGLAFLAIVAQASSCINTFGLPVALSKIGWYVYLIFCIWDLFEVIVIYFTVVETKGLTLEEIEEVFSQDDPVKYSIEHNFKAKPEASPSHA
ncbi:general substrate transporter [Exidia glandulosa HHB12029]|uniref:General substrate transporter n=1 Tax=Exidia glandulosa HHB12029 TaxID=1314781 RepID=A0A165QBF8_EXIGL|nr:general substrate transporter [Exidia glandulosa HHB12029]